MLVGKQDQMCLAGRKIITYVDDKSTHHHHQQRTTRIVVTIIFVPSCRSCASSADLSDARVCEMKEGRNAMHVAQNCFARWINHNHHFLIQYVCQAILIALQGIQCMEFLDHGLQFCVWETMRKVGARKVFSARQKLGFDLAQSKVQFDTPPHTNKTNRLLCPRSKNVHPFCPLAQSKFMLLKIHQICLTPRISLRSEQSTFSAWPKKTTDVAFWFAVCSHPELLLLFKINHWSVANCPLMILSGGPKSSNWCSPSNSTSDLLSLFLLGSSKTPSFLGLSLAMNTLQCICSPECCFICVSLTFAANLSQFFNPLVSHPNFDLCFLPQSPWVHFFLALSMPPLCSPFNSTSSFNWAFHTQFIVESSQGKCFIQHSESIAHTLCFFLTVKFCSFWLNCCQEVGDEAFALWEIHLEPFFSSGRSCCNSLNLPRSLCGSDFQLFFWLHCNAITPGNGLSTMLPFFLHSHQFSALKLSFVLLNSPQQTVCIFHWMWCQVLLKRNVVTTSFEVTSTSCFQVIPCVTGNAKLATEWQATFKHVFWLQNLKIGKCCWLTQCLRDLQKLFLVLSNAEQHRVAGSKHHSRGQALCSSHDFSLSHCQVENFLWVQLVFNFRILGWPVKWNSLCNSPIPRKARFLCQFSSAEHVCVFSSCACPTAHCFSKQSTMAIWSTWLTQINPFHEGCLATIGALSCKLHQSRNWKKKVIWKCEKENNRWGGRQMWPHTLQRCSSPQFNYDFFQLVHLKTTAI